MASSETLPLSRRLIVFVLRVFALRFPWGGEEELPHFIPRLCPAMPPPVPRLPGGLLAVVPSPPALAFAFFVEARRFALPASSGSTRTV
jgi:hypothetical protein